MKLKDLRKVIDPNQYISLVNEKGNFFKNGLNKELSCNYDEKLVKGISTGIASFGEYCIFISVS